MTDKIKLIDHLKNDIYCRIGVSKIAGVGVIAIRDIPRGINPFKTLSKHNDLIVELLEKDLKNIDKNVKQIVDDFFGNVSMITGKKIKIYDILESGPNNINISFYMNHSDESNVSTVEVKEKEYLEFVTNRYIHVGEELTINYHDYEF